jgi:hypothetical protein
MSLLGRLRKRKRAYFVPPVGEGESPPWAIPGPGPNVPQYDEHSYQDAMTGLMVAADFVVKGWNDHHRLLSKNPALRFDPAWRASTFGVCTVFEDLDANCRAMELLTIPPRWTGFHDRFMAAFAVLNGAGLLIRQGIETDDPEALRLGMNNIQLHNNAMNYEAIPFMPR